MGIEDVISNIDSWTKKDHRDFMNKLADVYKELVLYWYEKLIYSTPESPFYKRTEDLKNGLMSRKTRNKDEIAVWNVMYYSPYVEEGKGGNASRGKRPAFEYARRDMEVYDFQAVYTKTYG